jgi:hypothetical protein
VRSEDLLHESQLVLPRLTEDLELEAPLSTSYRLFEHTGKPGYGDPSPRILAGRILPRRERQLPLAISPAQRWRAQIAYTTCLSRLAHDARDVNPTLPSAIASGAWDRG